MARQAHERTAMERDFDIVVVGSGGAGNSAAIMACDAGLSVLMLEACSRIGGSTVLSGGVFMAGGRQCPARCRCR